MLTLRTNWFSTLWLAIALAISGCGGGGGGGGGGGKDGPGPVDPKPLELVSIEVTPANLSLPEGVSQQYTATGVYADTTTDDITDEVTWSTADSDVASISASGMVKGELAGGPIAISATLGAITGSTNVTVTNATLSSIDITPPSASVAAGLTQEYVATGTYSDGSTLDISSLVSWESSDEDVATVDANGVATALVKNDGITITATLDSANDTANLTVTDATLQSIEVTPSSFELAAGYEKQYEATGLLSDGSTIELTDAATWSSSDEDVATVGNDPDAGEVTAVKKGSAIIQAAFGGKTGSNELTVTDAVLVSIAVSADSGSLAAGYKQTYTAQGTYSDNSTGDLSSQVLWSVSNDTLALISNDDASKGEATALVAGGPLNVIATSDGVSGTKALTVTSAVLVSIGVSADVTELPAGQEQQFVATGVYSDGSDLDLTDQVTWNSSDELVAQVSNVDGSEGMVSALSAGDASIGAALDGVSGSLGLTVTAAVLESIEVESENDSLAVGSQQQYSATGLYSDGSTLDLTDVATWSSSDDGVAEISNAAGEHGLSTAIAAGSTTISASYDPGTGAISDSRSLTVTGATLVSITVTSGSDTLFAGLKQQYTATGVYSDNSEADITAFVTWSVPADVNDVTVASIDAEGLLTALAAGEPVLVSATQGAITGSTELTVGSAALATLVLVPMEHALPLGLTVQYMVTGIYTDETELDLTNDAIWSSSNETIASISNADGTKGQASAVAVGGPVTITATVGLESVSAELTVTNATLTSLVVTPANLDLPQGVSQQYVATATFSDSSVQDVTQAAVWSSSDEAVASISNAIGSQGLAQTHTSGGPVTITATLEAFSPAPATTELTVNDLTVTGIEVRPAETTCGRGKSKQFQAFVLYDDLSEQDLTAQMRWTSGATRLVSVGLTTGLAKTTGNPNRLGDAIITARLQGLSNVATVHKLNNKNACTP